MANYQFTLMYFNFYLEKLDIEYKPGAQAIYKQFALRSAWNRVKNQKDIDAYCQFIDDAW